MPRLRYYDLFIDVSEYNPANIKRVLLMAKHLGYRVIAIPFPLKDPENKTSVILNIARKIGINAFFRVDITKRKKINLDSIKIYSIEAYTENDFRRALRDRDANVITLSFSVFSDILTPENINLLMQFPGKHIEVTLKDIIFASPTERVQSLSKFFRKVKLANKPTLPLFFSSKASDVTEMLSPRAIRSFLKLIGFREETIIKCLIDQPRALLDLPMKAILVEEVG